MISTSAKVIDESRFISVHLQLENDTEISESSSNLEEQVQLLSTAAFTAQPSLTTEVNQIETVNDLGALLLSSKTSAEITDPMSKLSNSQRYIYFTIMYSHQSSYSYGCNQKFSTI